MAHLRTPSPASLAPTGIGALEDAFAGKPGSYGDGALEDAFAGKPGSYGDWRQIMNKSTNRFTGVASSAA
ncbi:hypothetical protein PS833_05567 [Pseudomonas fluorescens]|uniref:Uncharacterized protein n=1 Tax=Pseudomonas fluorescens TaxID=294 RepID=A0A5E7FFP7_PSEFL|nr:hypothetical protein PS833_05567 [Pseudomonas fluorescens]